MKSENRRITGDSNGIDGKMRSANGRIKGDLKERTKEFALNIIGLYPQLPRRREAQVIGDQLLRSGTSVGAHFREAQRAKSLERLTSGRKPTRILLFYEFYKSSVAALLTHKLGAIAVVEIDPVRSTITCHCRGIPASCTAHRKENRS